MNGAIRVPVADDHAVLSLLRGRPRRFASLRDALTLWQRFGEGGTRPARRVRMDVRTLIPWAVCVVLVMQTVVLLLIVALKQPETISIQTLEDEIKDGQITAIAIADEVLRVERADGSRAVVKKEQDRSFAEILTDLGITPGMMSGVEIRVMAPATSP